MYKLTSTSSISDEHIMYLMLLIIHFIISKIVVEKEHYLNILTLIP